MNEQCSACGLSKTRRFLVSGEGSLPADILFIGEAPGQSEDAVGKPFFGPSGRLLADLLKDARLDTVSHYVTNAVLCHPTDTFAGPNREPTDQEILMCQENLMEIITTARPKVTVFIGKIAERFYKKICRPNVTILHPAYLLRTGGKMSPYYLQTIYKLKSIRSYL